MVEPFWDIYTLTFIIFFFSMDDFIGRRAHEFLDVCYAYGIREEKFLNFCVESIALNGISL